MGSAALFICNARGLHKPFPSLKITNIHSFCPPGAKKPKIQIAFGGAGVIVPAMRTNPTAASGPVTIRHVRNTVPKALSLANNPARIDTYIRCGSHYGKTMMAKALVGENPLQLEETSL